MNQYSYISQYVNSKRPIALQAHRPFKGKRETRSPLSYERRLVWSPASAIVGLVAFFLVGCAGPMELLQNQWEEETTNSRLESLTEASYAKAATQIEGWKIGSPPEVTGCKLISWKEREKVRAISIACNGWVGPLSGGGWPGLGAFIGVSDGMVFGSHLYGYLYRESILVPRYAVTLQAERIDKTEYERLEGKKAHVGKVQVYLADEPELGYWKDLVIREVRKLNFEEPEFSDADDINLSGQEAVDAFVDLVRSYTTRERFDQARQFLLNIPVGADRWEVIQALGGRFHRTKSGKSYFLIMDGFLNIEELRITEVTANGFFKVWSFGYMEQVEAVPQLDLIFKNDKVFKLVPHVPKEELRNYW